MSYSENQKSDTGSSEILSQFSTLYPYLKLISSYSQNPDPFDEKTVMAYWVGNSLLEQIPVRSFVSHLDEKLNLKKKLSRIDTENIYNKIADGGLPHHSFHVLNIYKRTGHLDIPHTIQTMDACIINFGKVTQITKDSLYITTQPLTMINHQLQWGKPRERQLMKQGEEDMLFPSVSKGDLVSYHWGYFCTKLSNRQAESLRRYTKLSMNLVNSV